MRSRAWASCILFPVFVYERIAAWRIPAYICVCAEMFSWLSQPLSRRIRAALLEKQRENTSCWCSPSIRVCVCERDWEWFVRAFLQALEQMNKLDWSVKKKLRVRGEKSWRIEREKTKRCRYLWHCAQRPVENTRACPVVSSRSTCFQEYAWPVAKRGLIRTCKSSQSRGDLTWF